MTSLPNPSPVGLATPGPNRHRHRRSAAILGDFDVVGLGLYSPVKRKPEDVSSSTPLNYDTSTVFNFNNTDDFVQPSSKFGFSFPMDQSSPQVHMGSDSNSSLNLPNNEINNHVNNNYTNTPTNKPTLSFNNPASSNYAFGGGHRHSSSASHNSNIHNNNSNQMGNLNSPIRLGSRRTKLVHAGSIPRWESGFLGPDEQIDLDTVLRAMLIEKKNYDTNINGSTNTTNASITTNTTNTTNTPKNTNAMTNTNNTTSTPSYMGSPFGYQPHSDFLPSPFLKNLPILALPLLYPHFQPIQEFQPTSYRLKDNIDIEEDVDFEEEEEKRELKEKQSQQAAEDFEQEIDDKQTNDVILDQELMFANPPPLGGGLYSNDLANLSCLSLRSGRNTGAAIEKQFLNDLGSFGGGPSSFIGGSVNSGGTPSKRSAAKASRYQLFYDQHHKILNALKILSSESINIYDEIAKEHILAHSLLLPLLKTGQKRILSTYVPHKMLRFQHLVRDFSGPASNSNPNGIGGTALPYATRRMLPPSRGGRPQVHLLNSPNSVALEVLTTTIQLTERMSMNEDLTTGHLSIHDGLEVSKSLQHTADVMSSSSNTLGYSVNNISASSVESPLIMAGALGTLGTLARSTSEGDSMPYEKCSQGQQNLLLQDTPLIVVTEDVETPVLSSHATMDQFTLPPMTPVLPTSDMTPKAADFDYNGARSSQKSIVTLEYRSETEYKNYTNNCINKEKNTVIDSNSSIKNKKNGNTDNVHVKKNNINNVTNKKNNANINNDVQINNDNDNDIVDISNRQVDDPKTKLDRPRTRRPVLPQEEKLLRHTRIPSFKPRGRNNSHGGNDDTNVNDNASVTSNKRNSRFINWLKRNK